MHDNRVLNFFVFQLSSVSCMRAAGDAHAQQTHFINDQRVQFVICPRRVPYPYMYNIYIFINIGKMRLARRCIIISYKTLKRCVHNLSARVCKLRYAYGSWIMRWNYNIFERYCGDSCSSHLAAFMIDTFSRPESREKKKRTGIIIIIFYDVPTTRVIREISISANCRLIVSAPTLRRRPRRIPPHCLRTIWSTIKHTLTLQEVLSRFLGLQRKPFRSRSVRAA